MKPFDLQAALRGEPVMTRNGLRVEQIAYFSNARRQRRLAVQIGDEVFLYNEEGKLDNVFQAAYQNADLVMAPRKHEAWVNIYPSRAASWYSSEADADANCAPPKSRIGGKAHRIEWEE